MSGGSPPPRKRLGVLVDGVAMPEPEAHALWDRFSFWMEEHRGDLAGFAAQEGFVSVHPGVDGDRPVLRCSKTAEQRPYAPVGESGGSQDRQVGPASPDRRRRNPRELPRKPRK